MGEGGSGPAGTAGPSRPSGFLDWWLVDRRTGRRVLGQAPNPAILVFLGLTVLGWLVPDSAQPWETLLFAGSRVALGWWALDEVLRGANPLRRLLGAAALLWVGITVVQRLS